LGQLGKALTAKDVKDAKETKSTSFGFHTQQRRHARAENNGI
jgi:hypothetical protein